jgi:hypothetical protein
MNSYPKSKQARRQERIKKKFHPWRSEENRGWQIKSSAGMPVMQFIRGGRFCPLPHAE